jgi:hypothetical protein
MPRPTAVTVFGILNIIFGVLGLTCTPVGLLMSTFTGSMMEDMPETAQMQQAPWLEMMNNPAMKTYTYVSTALGMVAAALLLAAGIGLLKLRPWARMVSIGYAVYAILSVIVGGIFSYYFVYAPMFENMSSEGGPEAAGFYGGMIGGMFGGFCFSLIYPVLLLIFMFLPGVKAAFQPEWGTPPPVPPDEY